MASSAHDDARLAGADFARRFFEERALPWPDPTREIYSGNLRTAGRWDTGSYSSAVQAGMHAAFSAAVEAEAPGLTARWIDADVKAAWRAAAAAEFDRRLMEVARFPVTTGR